MSSKVDVVIVTKTVDEVLPETINGLKTYPFQKTIVIASKDSTKPDWCDILKIDKGKLGKARNTGIDFANSDYVCMVDADIVLTPGYVNDLLKYFQNSKVVAVGGKLKSSIRSLYALTKEQVFRGYCKVHSDLPCGGTVYRAETVKKERFNDNLSGGEDHELHTRLKKKKYRVIYAEKTSCFHYFKGDMKKEIFLCMFSGARTGLFSSLVRAAISPFRSLIYVLTCRDSVYSLFIPPFYVTQWIAHVLGAFFKEEEVRAKMRALG